jgi:hypothetical protein
MGQTAPKCMATPYAPRMNTSPEARVIASFTFIVALLLGAWGALDLLLAEPPSFLLSEPEPARFGIALLPFAATAVAFQAANAAEAAWAQALGSAAVMLGVLTSLGGVLYFLASW